ncbi:MAG: bifunctional diaminohydroxyphosphoribosylaminopyrimidine deaminase/5-amino-6-(5-phosphoribosylamino)uracil reductase RibD [Lentisphaeria bacterium]
MSTHWKEIEKTAMRRALSLARRAWGRTNPNPMVGAVILKDGKVVGEGYHRAAGTHHAEVEALRAAGEAARGATAVVNLEPCSTHGRTPPCTDALIRAGISRLVYGTEDPSPIHKGKGAAMLQKHGIEVEGGLCREACENLNAAFFCRVQAGRPLVCLKMAMTLDGKIATASGASQWVTGEEARGRVQKLRRWADAVMVGGETVRIDDPQLTVRQPKGWQPQPRKIIWTRNPDQFNKQFRIWQDSDNPPLFVTLSGRQEWLEWLKKLAAEKDVSALLIEGGGQLAGTVIAAGIVDQIKFFIAPKILGGARSRPVTGGPNPESLTEATMVKDRRMERIGDDYLLTGYLSDVHRID